MSMDIVFFLVMMSDILNGHTIEIILTAASAATDVKLNVGGKESPKA